MMDSGLVVAIVFVVFFILLIVEVPIAWSLAAAGTTGLVLLRGWEVAANALGAIPYQSAGNFLLTIVPMYILLGMFAKNALIAEDVYRIMNRILRRLPGGLGVATIAACAGFGAVSGSSVADVATIGRMSINEMRRYGYDTGLATGIVGSAGTLAILIPPSVVLVIYGSITGVSVGELLLAGLLPGLFSALVYMVFVVLRVSRNPQLTSQAVPVAALATTEASTSSVGATEEGRSGYGGLLKMVGIFAIVLGGIYAGLLTATESAAAGALAALVMLAMTFRKEPRRIPSLVVESLKEAAAITGTIFAIFFGATLFTFFFVSAGVPSAVADGIVSLDLSPWLIVGLILLVTIPLGMFLDGLSILLIVVPLVFPVVVGFGFSGVWFGILMVKVIEIGLITPPVGINAYMVAGVVDDVPVEKVFRGLVPFLAIDLVVTAALFAFPGIITWLPSLSAL